MTGLKKITMPTCSKLEFLLAGLEYSDVDLSLTQAQLKGAQVIRKPREHQQPRVVPRAELELDKHTRLPEEARDLQVVVGPGESHRFEQNVSAGIVHLFLRGSNTKKTLSVTDNENRHSDVITGKPCDVFCEAAPFVGCGFQALLSEPC